MRDLERRSSILLFLALGTCSIPAAAQTTHNVTVVGNTFSPANITIAQGDSVLWTGLQPLFHNVAETNCPATPSSAYNGGFYSGFPNAVPTFTHTFNGVGSFCYICESHVGVSMFGSVTVQASLPTLSTWGVVAMGLLLGAAGYGSARLVMRTR
jgi:plastocyanin